MALAVAALLTLASAACGPSSETSPGALVLIIIDTLRADRLGFMGYEAAHTPNLDALSRRGVFFDHAVTTVPVTLPSVTSLLTGRLPFRHGVRDNEPYVVADDEVTLAERLRDAGWRTAAVLGSAVLAADRGLDQGFETYDDDFQGRYPTYDASLETFADEFSNTRRRANVVTDRAIEVIDTMGHEPFFLMVHYFDPHSQYDPPPEFARLHPGSPYDGEIAFVDSEIGRLLNRLEKRQDALIVVVADHGEGLGDHGESAHGFLLYETTLRVPLVVSGPGVPAGIVRHDPVSLVDVEPTLASILGLARSESERDGHVLQWNRPEPEPRLLYAETCRTLVSYHWSELRSVRKGPWKLILGPPLELYNLEDDPDEQREVSRPEMKASLEKALVELTGYETRAQILEQLHGEQDPALRERMRSLGYVGGSRATSVEEGEYPHPRVELPRWTERQNWKVRHREAMALALKGRYTEAVARLDELIIDDPRADAFHNRALAKQKLGDEAGFKNDIEAALRADSNFVPALKVLATLSKNAGRHAEALQRWQRVHEIDPSDTSALRELSIIHLKRKEPALALPYLRTLVRQVPDDTSALFNLGLAAWNLGYYEEGGMHLRKFLQLAPNHSNATKVRQLLATGPGR